MTYFRILSSILVASDTEQEADFLKQAAQHLARVNNVLTHMIEFWSRVGEVLSTMVKKNEKAEVWRKNITKGERYKKKFRESVESITEVGCSKIYKVDEISNLRLSTVQVITYI